MNVVILVFITLEARLLEMPLLIIILCLDLWTRIVQSKAKIGFIRCTAFEFQNNYSTTHTSLRQAKKTYRIASVI